MSDTIYTNVTQRFNKIFFRGYKNGKRIQLKADYKPTLYVASDKKESDAKSIFGRILDKRKFDSIGEAKAFVKDNSEVLSIHGNTKYEYAFIHENFKGELNVLMSELTIQSIDIETSVEQGLTIEEMVRTGAEEILLISIIDNKTKELTTFGARPVDTSKVKNYVKCDNEIDLLKKFINFIETTDPDIITGWNSNPFDISYICTRITRILGEEWTQRLSPFRQVERKVSNIMGREVILYDIVGRCTLDLLELYKKYRFKPRESYRLDFIGEAELGERKLKNPYDTFKEHYQKDWNSFTMYNQQDVLLVDKLEDKLGLIYLAITLAYICKINFDDVYSPVKMWEQYIQNSLLEENTFCPLKTRTNSAGYRIEGGYVKEPVTGLYKWIISFDFTSLYPKIIEALNMSPECLIGMTDNSVQKMLSGFVNESQDNTLAANGSMYSKDQLGIMTRLTAHMFSKRKEAKDQMKIAKNNVEILKEEKAKRLSIRMSK